MANLIASRPDQRQEGILIDVPLAAVKVFKGANVSYNAAGFAKGSSDTTGEVFAGVAIETVDNSAGAAGAKIVRVWREGVLSMPIVGATQAAVGKNVYAVDDNVVGLTTTNSLLVGKVVQFVSATEVRVKI